MEKVEAEGIITDPAIWPSTNHGAQVPSTVRLSDFIHSMVPIYGTAISWSPLHRQGTDLTQHSICIVCLYLFVYI